MFRIQERHISIFSHLHTRRIEQNQHPKPILANVNLTLRTCWNGSPHVVAAVIDVDEDPGPEAANQSGQTISSSGMLAAITSISSGRPRRQ
jgi:hypothetical protein